MKPLQIPLEPGNFYHVFNRGNNGDNLFYKPENYQFFLRRLDQYLSPYLEVFAFCLLPNHFHLLVRVKERDEVKDSVVDTLQLDKVSHPDPVSKAFHRFFTSYSKAINKQEKRHGSLIENPFKRIFINSTNYLAHLVFYIHVNPQLHGICEDFRQYPWSSYERILKSKPSKLKKEEVVHWFNTKENYVSYHSQQIDIEKIRELLIE
jgi:REP element-mobilizing transposase RayT